MAKGDTRRTFMMTDEAIEIIDWLNRETAFDKSDCVDRAIKYYWRDLQNGELDDPAVTEDIGNMDPQLGDDGTSDKRRSIMDRLRGDN